jgi:hypothetical protein
LYDDGTHGDVTAGDGKYSFNTTVAIGTSGGSKNMPVTITDLQGRSGTANIGVTIIPSTSPTGSGSATPNSGIPGATTLLTVQVTNGGNPQSTGMTVSGDLTEIGGSATTTFHDDGLNGDATANDGTFSFLATVGNSATPGLHVLPMSISDAQGRTGSASIAFNVPAPGALSGSGLAEPGTAGLADTVTLLVSVIPGTSPTSSGLAVTANLSAIGGSPSQVFVDDGTNGDQTAGDHVYTFVGTIPSNISLGTKLLPVTITDAQSRSGTATIQINIVHGNDVIFADGFE